MSRSSRCPVVFTSSLAAMISLAAAACSSHPPTTTPVAPPAASTTCFAGYSSGMGQRARTIARRTVDPAAHQIIEERSHDEAGAHGAKSFHVVMTIDGDHFTMTETGGAFSGTGTLVGEPWQWSAWTSVSQIPSAGITIESADELTEAGMKATKQIKKDGKLLATTTDELQTIDCADWDTVKAALAVPILDRAACERACRNFATLKFWDHIDPDDHARHEAELASKLEAGLPACVTQCLSANNPTQTACMGAATSVTDLVACE